MITYVVEVPDDTDIMALPGVYVFKSPLKGAELAVRTLDRICKSPSATRSVLSPSGGFSSVRVPKFSAQLISRYLNEAEVMSVLLLNMVTAEERTYSVKIYKTFIT